MFVITADQIDSRNDRDRAGEMIAGLVAEFGDVFTLPPDQTAGDEIQMLLADARTSLDLVLALHRSGHWSIGLGVGTVRTPLPDSARQASGEAFVGARDAVTRAKKADTRFGLTAEPVGPAGPAGARQHRPVLDGEQVEALIATFLLLRQRRTSEGWAAVDLRETGLTQVEIAARLGISTAAVSQRLRSALWKVDRSARPALVRLLEDLDNATTGTGPST
ncbi:MULTISPECIES: sigma factor-like helix-turn-helix DNA-binding protein [Cryobacterium]|uniref:DNA-binding protein n=1 Tax=Cryobacterium mannosilyticum TaxID=1259190 RepID=A0A4R8W1W2_9MICO|nr:MULTISPECIES: sigma factor-like helix-turn-helix DNA-binding protein [Cryobacterium]TFB95460.1 DNA-binding protein [Cryobacterium sp. HLT2-28]TFC00910.1 DNA-binding protein [Cryobacterium mannosilyticum]